MQCSCCPQYYWPVSVLHHSTTTTTIPLWLGPNFAQGQDKLWNTQEGNTILFFRGKKEKKNRFIIHICMMFHDVFSLSTFLPADFNETAGSELRVIREWGTATGRVEIEQPSSVAWLINKGKCCRNKQQSYVIIIDQALSRYLQVCGSKKVIKLLERKFSIEQSPVACLVRRLTSHYSPLY